MKEFSEERLNRVITDLIGRKNKPNRPHLKFITIIGYGNMYKKTIITDILEIKVDTIFTKKKKIKKPILEMVNKLIKNSNRVKFEKVT